MGNAMGVKKEEKKEDGDDAADRLNADGEVEYKVCRASVATGRSVHGNTVRCATISPRRGWGRRGSPSIWKERMLL